MEYARGVAAAAASLVGVGGACAAVAAVALVFWLSRLVAPGLVKHTGPSDAPFC
jgi:hypothetical protein